MIRLPSLILHIALLATLALAPLGAQEPADPDLIDTLLDQALSAAERGEWDLAFTLLDEAATLAPDDPRVDSYRRSLTELAAVDQAQNSWNEGRPTDVENPDSAGQDNDQTTDESPRFVIDRSDRFSQDDPSLGRANVRAIVEWGLLSRDSLTGSLHDILGSGQAFLYGGWSADLSYWLPFIGRSIGLSLRYDGSAWPPEEPQRFASSVDMGINLRGFLFEDIDSRLEIGIDLGGAIQFFTDAGESPDSTVGAYLGIWLEDPLFYHILNVEALKPLIIGGDLRLYSNSTQTLLDTVTYRLDARWAFPHWNVGTRLSWVDFTGDDSIPLLMTIGITAGLEY